MSLQITIMRQKSRITARVLAVARKLAADGGTVTSKMASYEVLWMTRSPKFVDFFSFFKTQMRIIWHGNAARLANWAIPYCSGVCTSRVNSSCLRDGNNNGKNFCSDQYFVIEHGCKLLVFKIEAISDLPHLPQLKPATNMARTRLWAIRICRSFIL